MRGDFSIWRDEHRQNFNGVLHQQGRVLLDADWNAQTEITNDWQDTAGRDVIGAGVAGVPADSPDSFKVKSAVVAVDGVTLTVAPGRVWADGLLAFLDAQNDVTRTATYLPLPLETVPGNLGAVGTRDAVVLEVWREEINGFQLPDLLIEPALGGPDTTERVHTEMAFRLFRLTDPKETCESVVGKLQDDFSVKGKLIVTLDAPPPPTGDCPTIQRSGYTGFEHNLYRIEIAQVEASGDASFKWSQFGGGLVGRGDLKNADLAISPNANQQAIVNSGLAAFYLEIVSFNAALGYWTVTYGANVTLGSDGVLNLPDPLTDPTNIKFGALPADGNVFFRLWNGLKTISAFTGVNPVALQDGILLKFDPVGPDNYRPADYWTFSVRAGEITNTTPLIDHKPPAGIHYHRVPLGILKWIVAGNPATIEDCRRIFQPLTRLATCCTYRVGDGMHSHGDFTRIGDALAALPDEGGEICVLPGTYVENILIDRKHDITIKGCGRQTRIVSPAPGGGGVAAPVFHIKESQNIKILSLAVTAHDTGTGVRLEGAPFQVSGSFPTLHGITLENLFVQAAQKSAIDANIAYDVSIRRCRIEMKDTQSAAPAIFFVGEEALIAENDILVADEARRRQTFDVIDPLDADLAVPVEAALGGLQLGGGCERVRVINNTIARGIGHGIILGSLQLVTTVDEKPVPNPPPTRPDPCKPCRHGDNQTPEPDDPQTSFRSAGDLSEIVIAGNRIFNMGLNGIGVVSFFPLDKVDEFITVHRLLIEGNDIRRCLYRELQDIPAKMENAIGYGGIALADVETLVIRDNFIVDNGPDFRQPICGIYVLHGEGMEISRNHILNNGAKPPNSQEKANSVKRGARGGIFIAYALAPTVPIRIGEQTVPVQAGLPALKVHDNAVSVPVGQALAVMAVGPVLVVGNEFTSHGMSFRDATTFVASTVMIVNLGISNEFFLQLASFELLKKGNQSNTTSGQAGLDDLGLGRSLSNGNVLFNDNQCVLDFLESGLSLSLSSILILSLDDIGFQNNQCECNLLDDFILANAILAGISVRATDNRFKDWTIFDFLPRGFDLPLSAVTVGLFNTTTDNQSTHCLWIIGAPNLTVDNSNVSLRMLNNPRACCQFVTHKRECFEGGTNRDLSQAPAQTIEFVPG